jgi:FKBP-type peptidyl-prolyl cis-trans isomerase (trigger factor)
MSKQSSKNQIASNIKINKLEKSKIEIVGSIDTKDFVIFRNKALQNINDEVSIDGFRKGKVPENVLISKVGEMSVLEEMAELALSKAYPEIIVEEKIDAIGRPEISITKLAIDNPLEFKIVTTVTPEIKLGDYKKIAKTENKKPVETFEVTEKEIEDALVKIKSSHVDHEGHDHDSPESKEEIKKYLLENKKIQAQEKKRITISDLLMESSIVEIPDLLIDSEARRIEAQFSDDITRMGVTLEDYLKHAKKTIEEIRKEWRPSAEKKAKLQLILNEIVKAEKIEVDPKEIEEEVGHILAHYKDANPEHAYTYAETVLTNEKVYQFLESVE